jgi:DNA (cytosine-5)-methyltransferase 1
MNKTKVLNLYAGIGGNRKLWKDVDVTAVEWDEDKAEVYRDHFPNDEVIVTDAHEYLLENHNDYDFIWASPPCPTHSQIRKITSGDGQQNDPVYPDMKLWQEVLFLEGYFSGYYTIENVRTWYDPLVEPQHIGRHYFWTNYHISTIHVEAQNNQYASVGELENKYGFDLDDYGLDNDKAMKMLRNCVDPKLGKHVFESRGKQTTLL